MIVGALALAGFFVALYLLLYKLGMIGALNCSVGSCETVNTSKWATFLGLPVAAWGVAFYAGLLALSLVSVQERYANSKGMSQALVLYSGAGLVFSTWLTYLELFVIHAVCQWCVVSAVIVLAIFATTVLDYREFD